MPTGKTETCTTTLRLPRPVYDEAKRFVEQRGATTGTSLSLNEFMVTAIEAFLKMQRRREINLAFAGMAEDAVYQKEAQSLAKDFEPSDWEAALLREKDIA
jgi:hypothetical protein